MKYVVYYIEQVDFYKRGDEYTDYSDFKTVLREIDEDSQFTTKQEAIERLQSLISKNVKLTILEVYG